MELDTAVARSVPHGTRGLPTFTLVASVELSEPNACTVHVTAIAAEFAKRGHRTTLLAPRPRGGVPAIDVRAQGVEVRFTPSARPLGLPNAFGFLILLPAVVRLALGGRAEVLYLRAGSLSFLVAGLARLLGRSYVMSEHNGWLAGELLTLGKRPLVARLARQAQLLDARLADKVLVVSAAVGQHLVRAGVPAGKLFVAGNGTDTERLHPLDRETALAHWGLPSDRRYVGFLGTLAAWQGIDQAVQALPLLAARDPMVHLVIGGDGPERSALVQLVRRLGVTDRVTFTGHVPIPEANSLLNCFDVAVAPKTAEIAALGMSPLKLRDYAAAGRPVTAPDVPGVREYADAGWIALYDPSRPEELAVQVGDLLRDPRRRAAMRAAARAYAVAHFAWTHTADTIAAQLPGVGAHDRHLPDGTADSRAR